MLFAFSSGGILLLINELRNVILLAQGLTAAVDGINLPSHDFDMTVFLGFALAGLMSDGSSCLHADVVELEEIVNVHFLHIVQILKILESELLFFHAQIIQNIRAIILKTTISFEPVVNKSFGALVEILINLFLVESTLAIFLFGQFLDDLLGSLDCSRFGDCL